MGYNPQINQDKFTFSLNVESLLIVLAINSGLIVTLNEIPGSHFLFEAGDVAYNGSSFSHPNYPGMDPVVCLYHDIEAQGYSVCTVS